MIGSPNVCAAAMGADAASTGDPVLSMGTNTNVGVAGGAACGAEAASEGACRGARATPGIWPSVTNEPSTLVGRWPGANAGAIKSRCEAMSMAAVGCSDVPLSVSEGGNETPPALGNGDFEETAFAGETTETGLAAGGAVDWSCAGVVDVRFERDSEPEADAGGLSGIGDANENELSPLSDGDSALSGDDDS